MRTFLIIMLILNLLFAVLNAILFCKVGNPLSAVVAVFNGLAAGFIWQALEKN